MLVKLKKNHFSLLIHVCTRRIVSGNVVELIYILADRLTNNTVNKQQMKIKKKQCKTFKNVSKKTHLLLTGWVTL